MAETINNYYFNGDPVNLTEEKMCDCCDVSKWDINEYNYDVKEIDISDKCTKPKSYYPVSSTIKMKCLDSNKTDNKIFIISISGVTRGDAFAFSMPIEHCPFCGRELK